MRRRRLLVSNSKPVLGWAFTLLWLGALALGTPAYAQSRLPTGVQYGDVILASFWAFGVGAAVFFLRIPRTTVHLDKVEVIVTERWLCATREHHCPRGQAAQVVLVEGTDTDSDPYFRCRLTTPSGRAITIAEGHQRDAVDEARCLVLASLASETRAQ
jgi:hypothetical protein